MVEPLKYAVKFEAGLTQEDLILRLLDAVENVPYTNEYAWHMNSEVAGLVQKKLGVNDLLLGLPVVLDNQLGFDHILLKPVPLKKLNPEPSTPRTRVLSTADKLVNGDRNNQYGPPTQDFQRTADMLSAAGFSVEGEPLKAHHVALMMSILKISRLMWSPDKEDSWVDLAGYAACGYECAIDEDK